MVEEHITGGPFEEEVRTIAEKIRSPEADEEGTQATEESRDAQKKQNMEQIKMELKGIYGTESDKPTETTIPPPQEKEVKDDYLEGVSEEYKEKTESLLQHAFTNGILPATKAAQKTNDPYLIDLFHDALAHTIHEKIQNLDLL